MQVVFLKEDKTKDVEG